MVGANPYRGMHEVLPAIMQRSFPSAWDVMRSEGIETVSRWFMH